VSDNDLKTDYHDVHEVCHAGWDLFNGQAQLDLDYYHRAQHTCEEVARADEQDRILHTMDKIQRQVSLLEGYEIKNRHILKIGPLARPDERESWRSTTATGLYLTGSSGGLSYKGRT
jgi:hypothetical protein